MGEEYYYECNQQHAAIGGNILWECTITTKSKIDDAAAEAARLAAEAARVAAEEEAARLAADKAVADKAVADQAVAAAAEAEATQREAARLAAEETARLAEIETARLAEIETARLAEIETARVEKERVAEETRQREAARIAEEEEAARVAAEAEAAARVEAEEERKQKENYTQRYGIIYKIEGEGSGKKYFYLNNIRDSTIEYELKKSNLDLNVNDYISYVMNEQKPEGFEKVEGKKIKKQIKKNLDKKLKERKQQHQDNQKKQQRDKTAAATQIEDPNDIIARKKLDLSSTGWARQHKTDPTPPDQNN